MIKTITPKTRIIISMIIWGTIGMFVREIPLSSIEIAFFRAFLGSLFLIVISLINKEKINMETLKENLFLLSLCGITLGINWIALFQAMKHTTISNAILSYYFAPVFIVIFSAVLLKEKMSIKNIICLAGAILGLFLIMKSGSSETINNLNHIKGIGYGLAGAVLYAIVVILNKRIKGLSGFQSTLIQLSIAAMVLLPMILGKASTILEVMDMKTWILVLILGIVHTGIAYLLYFSSVKDLKGQEVAILSYVDPLVSIAMSVAILKESISISQAFGGAMILGFTLINELNVNIFKGSRAIKKT